MPDSDLIATMLAALGGGLVAAGALAAWLGSVWKERIARSEAALLEVDIDLRLRRIEAYQPLWVLTALLPRWPRHTEVTYEQLLSFTESLRVWYFGGGGMYLSRTTHRDGYYPLQEELERLLGQGRQEGFPSKRRTTTVQFAIAAAPCAATSPRTSRRAATRLRARAC